MSANQANKEPHIVVNDLTMAYGSFVVQRELIATLWTGAGIFLPGVSDPILRRES